MNPDVFIVASDRSVNLVSIAAQHARHSVSVADSLNLPHPPARFDFAISVAVIHHLSTPERRIAAIRALLEPLRPLSSSSLPKPGRALIFVWALEQKSSRRGWDESHEQDVMVPWVMKQKQSATSKDSASEQTYQRYYHLYREGELEHDLVAAGGRVIELGYEKDNWWAIAEPKTEDA